MSSFAFSYRVQKSVCVFSVSFGSRAKHVYVFFSDGVHNNTFAFMIGRCLCVFVIGAEMSLKRACHFWPSARGAVEKCVFL